MALNLLMDDHFPMSAKERLGSARLKTKVTFAPKLNYFKSLIYDSETVNIHALREACVAGIPEERGIRAATWKVVYAGRH